MSTIRSDVADTETNASGEFDATAAFLSEFMDKDEDALKKEPSETGTEEDENAPEGDDTETEGSDDSPETDGDDDDAGAETEGSDKEKQYAESDDIVVKIKEGDNTHEVPLKDLKRLYGQEAALTRKSQEVAAKRQEADAEAQKAVTTLSVLLQRAQEKAQPYKAIDWMAVSKDPNISAEEASMLRTEAQKALEEETFLGQNLGAFMQEVQNKQNTQRVESAKTCVKALTTTGTAEKPNPLHIEGWNDKTYDDVRSFGVKMGLPAETVNTLTDPAAIKMMHMAMQFSKGTSKVQTIKTDKVNKTPKKIVKTSSSPSARPTKNTVEQTNALKTLKRSGSIDAAGDALLASFADD